jgi:hypothetical protein
LHRIADKIRSTGINFHRGPNGRHIIDAGTADYVTPGGGDELIAELTIGGGLSGLGSLAVPLSFEALAEAVIVLGDDARRDQAAGGAGALGDLPTCQAAPTTRPTASSL